jgi:hypothetical protein
MVLFASRKKDNVNMPPSTVAAGTLTTGWEKMKFIDSSGFLDIFFINHTSFVGKTEGTFLWMLHLNTSKTMLPW